MYDLYDFRYTKAKIVPKHKIISFYSLFRTDNAISVYTVWNRFFVEVFILLLL